MGDNGYGCRHYLLTPVLNPVTRAEERYNSSHRRTRNIVERCFGIWKRRFPCLRRVLSTKIETSVAIICAVAVLHNMARPNIDAIIDADYHEDAGGLDENIIENPNANAIQYRRAFIITHFSNNNN